MYVTEEQQFDTSFDHDCSFTYSLNTKLYNSITFHDRLSIHSNQVSNRHCNNMQHATPHPSIRCAHFCQMQNSNDPPIVYIPMETPKHWKREGQVDLVCERDNKKDTLTSPARFLYRMQTSTIAKLKTRTNQSSRR